MKKRLLTSFLIGTLTIVLRGIIYGAPIARLYGA